MTKIPNKLSNLEIQIASLIASGMGEIQAASSVGRSRQFLTLLKKRPEFLECVEDFTENFKNTLKENQKEAWLENVRDHKTKMVYASDKLFEVATLMLAKLLERVRTLDSEELKASNLSNNLKSCADSFASAIDFDCQILGVDRVITELKAVQKLTGNTMEHIASLKAGDELTED